MNRLNYKMVPVLLTVNEVADLLQVSESTVRRLVRTQALPVVRIRRSVRVKSETLIEFIRREGPGGSVAPRPTEARQKTAPAVFSSAAWGALPDMQMTVQGRVDA